jgi:hypothetical protein
MYIVKQAFKAGKDESGKPLFFKEGDKFPKDHPRAKEFAKAGLIKSKEDIDLENLHSVEKAIEAKKAELASLLEQAEKLKADKASKHSHKEQGAGAKLSAGNK